MTGVANAVAAGIGLGPIPALTFEDPVFKGVLVPILTEHVFAEATLYLVYVSRKYVPLKIRTFVDFICGSLQVALSPRFPLRSPEHQKVCSMRHHTRRAAGRLRRDFARRRAQELKAHRDDLGRVHRRHDSARALQRRRPRCVRQRASQCLRACSA